RKGGLLPHGAPSQARHVAQHRLPPLLRRAPVIVVAQIDTKSGFRYPEIMATRSTLNVSLTPELDTFVSSRVATGRYQSASEVVREALRLLEERELERDAALAELRQKIAVGLVQARQGELLDGEAVFEELERQ